MYYKAQIRNCNSELCATVSWRVLHKLIMKMSRTELLKISTECYQIPSKSAVESFSLLFLGESYGFVWATLWIFQEQALAAIKSESVTSEAGQVFVKIWEKLTFNIHFLNQKSSNYFQKKILGDYLARRTFFLSVCLENFTLYLLYLLKLGISLTEARPTSGAASEA